MLQKLGSAENGGRRNVMPRQPYANFFARKKKILTYLEEHKAAATEELFDYVKASPATVRRDLNRLEREGEILRERGRIYLPQETVSDFTKYFTNLEGEADREKKELAAYAAGLIEEREVIFIGAGKTCNFLAGKIKNIAGVTVFTNNVSVVLELSGSNIPVFLLGGEIAADRNHIETLSDFENLRQSLGGLFFDRIFITVDGIDQESGYTIRERRQIALYSHLIHSSRRFYILANQEKFGNRSFVPVFGLPEVKTVIAARGIPEIYRVLYKKLGVELHIV